MAGAFEMSIHPRLSRTDTLDAKVDFDPYAAGDITQLVDTWRPLSLALNNLNRAMGQADLYPFVLSNPSITKLGFIHDMIRATASQGIPLQMTPESGDGLRNTILRG